MSRHSAYLLGDGVELVVDGLGVVAQLPGLEGRLHQILQVLQTSLHIISTGGHGVTHKFTISPRSQRATDLLNVACNGKCGRSLRAQATSQTQQMRGAQCVVGFVTRTGTARWRGRISRYSKVLRYYLRQHYGHTRHGHRGVSCGHHQFVVQHIHTDGRCVTNGTWADGIATFLFQYKQKHAFIM